MQAARVYAIAACSGGRSWRCSRRHRSRRGSTPRGERLHRHRLLRPEFRARELLRGRSDPRDVAAARRRVALFPYAVDPDADENELEVGIEAEVGVAPSQTSSDPAHKHDSYFAPVFLWRAHAILRLSNRTVRPFLLVGLGGETVASTSPYMEKETDPVYYWGLGLDLPITETVGAALRYPPGPDAVAR